jgi:hypothetical protein
MPDPVTGVPHGLVRGPASEEHDRPFSLAPRRFHHPVVEAKKVKTFPAHLQVHNAGLGQLGLQPQLCQQCG